MQDPKNPSAVFYLRLTPELNRGRNGSRGADMHLPAAFAELIPSP